jgi:hypothetical protein
MLSTFFFRLLQDYNYNKVEVIIKFLLSEPPTVPPMAQQLMKQEKQVVKSILATQKRGNKKKQVCMSLKELCDMASTNRFCSLSKLPGVWLPGNTSRLSFDRIVPGIDGGKYEKGNVQILNKHLNIVKSIFPMEQLVSWYGTFKSNKLGDILARLRAHNASAPLV